MTVKELIDELAVEADMMASYTGTGQRIVHHKPGNCDGNNCSIHRPSGHHMTMWPLHFRGDRAPLMERICRHGVGHPDPDCIEWLQVQDPDGAWDIHGCDGCCAETDGFLGGG